MFSLGTGGHFVKDFFAATGTFRCASEGEAEGPNAVTALTLST
jgi:hypothetical protein